MKRYHNNEKENIVIFNGRLCDEKQPWLFDELKEEFQLTNIKFISTQELSLSKDDYYKLLAKSKIIVSYALQENFGYGVNEAVSLGCLPILPNRLVYPSLYGKEFLYNKNGDVGNMVSYFIKNYDDLICNNKSNQIEVVNENIFNEWFK